MADKFVVQVKTDGKWTSAYRGDDQEKTYLIFSQSVSEFGEDVVRVLKNGGLTDEGKVKWVVERHPEELAVEPEPEPEIEEEEIVDEADNSKTSIGSIYNKSNIAIAAIIVIGFMIGFTDFDDTSTVSSAASVSQKGPRLKTLERTLAGYITDGFGGDQSNMGEMMQSMALMEIMMDQAGGSIYGADVGSHRESTVESGTVLFKGRTLEAGIVETNVQIVNRQEGVRKDICIRMAGILDQEFELIRSIQFMPCSSTSNEYLEWVSKEEFRVS